MNHKIFLPVFALALLTLPACRQPPPEPAVDMGALRQAVTRKTEELYLIHLKLDSAAAAITQAELKARGTECRDAEFLAADAYQYLERADQDLLQLGRDLQELFNLDVEMTNRN